MISVDRALQDIIALLSNCLEAFTSALFLWDERSRLLKLRAYHSLSNQIIPAAEFSPEDGGLVGWAAKNNQPLQVDHFDRHTRTIPYYRRDENIKSFLALPLGGDKGVICVDSKRQYVFTSKDQKLLSGFVTIINHALAAEQTGKRHLQLRQILRLWSRVDARPVDADDPIPYFSRLLDSACHYLQADAALVAVPVKEGRFLQPVAASGQVPSRLLKTPQPATQGISAWIFRNRKSLIVRKFRSPARVPYLFGPRDGIGEIGALIGMPLAWKADEVGGVIVFICRSEAQWRKEEISAITALVRRATLVLQNFTLRRELALVRNLDPVTEVCNAEAFDCVMDKRLQRCQQGRTSLGLAIVAVQGLESLAARVALPDLAPLRQRLASTLLKQLKERQLLGCLSLAHFAVLFEDERPEKIRAQLISITDAIQRQVLDHLEQGPNLRVSCGLALYPRDAVEARQLWIKAFQKLDPGTSGLQPQAAPAKRAP